MATKKTTNRRNTGSPARARKTYGPTGTMGAKEKQMLAIAARQAFDHQAGLGRVEPGQNFDEWRHEQVMDQVGKSGLRECAHADFRPLLAWFQQLAGVDDKALATRLRSGKVTTGSAPGDTREAREKLAHQIRSRLSIHLQLATKPWPELLDLWTAASKIAWAEGIVLATTAPSDAVPGRDPWPGLDSKGLNKAMDRKLAIEAAGGPIREGYLVTVARQKTSRPDLSLGRDIYAGLADRCTVKQLGDLLSTLVNRINAREGVGSPAKRNKKQKTTAEKRRRSKHEIDTPAVFDPFEQLRRERGA